MQDAAFRGMNVQAYPLSNSQINIWNLERANQGTSINVICEAIRIRGVFDISLIQQCLNIIVKSDISLRTQISVSSGEPMQYEVPFTEKQFPVYDFTTTNEKGIHHWEEVIARQSMALYDSPLCQFIIIKLGECEGSILIKTHHIISDGWSQVLLINRIASTYLALVNAEDVQLEEAPSYRLHVEDEKQYLTSKAYQRDRSYWQQCMALDAQPASLKTSSSACVSSVGLRKSFEFPQLLSQSMIAFCNQYRVTPFAAYYMALAIYLKRIGGADCFRIGVPIYNRINATDRETSGMFVSTLPFTGTVDENWSFSEFLEYLTENWYDMLRHQRFPLSQIMELIHESHQDQQGPAYNIALSFQGSRIYCNQNTEIVFSGQWLYSGYQSEHLCIHLSNMENERRFLVNYDYLTQLFSEKEIEELHCYITNILKEALAAPGKPIWQLSVISTAEKERVLFQFNRYDQLYRSGTIGEKFRDVVNKYPDRAAVIKSGVRTNYKILREKADDISHALSGCVPSGQGVVGILLPKSVELMAAMTGVAQAGHAWMLLSMQWPKKRLEEVLKDSGACALISTQEYARGIQCDVPVLDASTLPQTEKHFTLIETKPADLAYVVYTSGSTGKPKGTEIEQRSLLNFAEGFAQFYGHDAVLSSYNVSFDAFLIDSMCALLNGRTIVLPEEEDLENGARLASLIRRYAVGFFSMTPSRLAAYCRDHSFLASLCRIENILCGGEHFSSELLMLLKRHTSARIFNMYGPSETTVGVSCCQLNEAARISIGTPMPGCRLYVLDEHRQPLPVGVYGELYVGGVCVGRGYRNDTVLTDEVFFENPFEYGERIYKTGDIACWTPNGEIILRGRKDEQVKLRGLRIEPQEIAARLAQHPAVESAFVRVMDISGQQNLIAYYTSKNPIPEHELLAFAATYLPSYMIPSYFLRLGTIPMTQNGKIDMDSLPKPDVQYSDVPACTDMQKKIVGIFEKVLGTSGLSASSDYFQNGGNSLNALETLALLEEAFDRRLRAADLWACRNAVRLENLLMGSQSSSEIKALIEPAPILPDYPLSSTQQSIYVQSMQDPTNIAYNMPGALRIGGKLDVKRLEGALNSLVASQSVLRTSFHMTQSGLRQTIANSVPSGLTVLYANSIAEAAEQFVRPFELSRAPLFRAAIWHENENNDVLFIDMHHIIMDGLSTPLIIEQLNALYNGYPLELPLIDFKDYAYWQASVHTELQPQLRDFWIKAMEGLEGPLDIPLDYTRPKQFDFYGDVLTVGMPSDLQKRIDDFTKKNQITPFMLFMGAFGILLHKTSGSEDFVVGTPVAGRPSSELMQVMGTFIQTLPLRLKPRSDISAKDYLISVQESVVGLLDNQQIPLEEVITLSNRGRELGRSTLYNTMLTMRPIDDAAFVIGGHPAQTIHLPTHTSKLDLSVEVYQHDGMYGMNFEYATSLFNKETIELYSRSYLQILRSLMADHAIDLAEISGVDVRDHINLFENRHHMYTPFVDLPIDKIIEQKAKLNPDVPAMIFHNKTTTYRELMDRASHIAGRLYMNGAKKGDVIGFALQRGVDMIAAIIGIMQLGCAYMPMLTSYPENRLRAMTQIAGVSLVLSDDVTTPQLPTQWQCKAIPVEGETVPFDSVENRSTGELMYVLFTSGSTGKPKGVMLPHRALANLLGTLTRLLDLTTGSVLCTTNATFDIFFSETLLVLCCGRCIVMADEEEMTFPWKMAELIEHNDVRVMQLTPSRLQMCLGNDAFTGAASKLSMMLLVGEAFSVPLKDRLRLAGNGNLCIMNMYGPTEAAVYATMADVTDCGEMIIGKPLRNCRAYVLDEQLNPVMPTAWGELYLAGECLAKGYIGQQEITEASFLPDPWFPNQKMYRTGDIVRMLADGNYVFLGRRDSQIKLNGQRVELGEISERAIATGYVKEAVAVAYQASEGMAIKLYAVANEQRSVGEAELIELLKKDLPIYMIPAEIVFLSELPRSAAGKTDLRALNEASLAAIGESTSILKSLTVVENEPSASGTVLEVGAESEATEHEVPESIQPSIPVLTLQSQTEANTMQAGEPDPMQGNAAILLSESAKPTVEQIVALWKQVLSKDSVDMSLSFFKQGGTSLGALHLLSLYFNHGWTMTLAQFYENPTPSGQIALFGVVPKGPTETEQESDVTKESAFVTEELAAIPVAPRLMKAKEQDAVLLTGATGFLGAHLLKELLDKGTRSVVCTVRNGDANRLWDALIYYFGKKWLMDHFRHITAVSGDVQLHTLGIDCEYHAKVLSRVGCIVHSAADVRHYAQDDGHYKTNYDGTRNVIELAKAWGLRLYHISTISVSGDYLVNNPNQSAQFSETSRDIGQNWCDNIYVRTKFMAENLVFDAIESGLDAKIFRVGRLVGRSADGVFQPNPKSNTFYDVIVALRLLEQIPSSFAPYEIEMTAVDDCARAIVALLNGKRRVYHIFNPHTVPLITLMQSMGIQVVETDDETFRRYLISKLDTGRFEEFSPLVETYNRLQSQKVTIKPKCGVTVVELLSKRFVWQEPNVELLLKNFIPAGSIHKGGD